MSEYEEYAYLMTFVLHFPFNKVFIVLIKSFIKAVNINRNNYMENNPISSIEKLLFSIKLIEFHVSFTNNRNM